MKPRRGRGRGRPRKVWPIFNSTTQENNELEEIIANINIDVNQSQEQGSEEIVIDPVTLNVEYLETSKPDNAPEDTRTGINVQDDHDEEKDSDSISIGDYGDPSSSHESEASITFTPPTKRKKKLETNRRVIRTKGRDKSTIWNEYYADESNGTKIWRCKACKANISGKADRLQKHFDKCKLIRERNRTTNRVSMNSEKSKASSAPSTQVSNREIENTVNGLQSAITEDSSKAKVSQVGMGSFLDRMRPNAQNDLDEKLGKFIFSRNLPFNIVEDKYFKDFINSLRPSYKIPSHEVIGTTILNKVYNDIEKNAATDLAGKEVTILQDGWSSNQRRSVIAHSVSTGTRNYFINAIDTGTNSKTADYCLELFENELDRLEEKYKCKVIGGITDNCNTMESMRRKITHSHPDLIIYGCNSHLLNLVGQKLTPELLRNQVVQVQNFFRNHDYPSAKLKEINGCRPILPGDTRWNSQLDCFESYKNNQAKYLDISRDSRSNTPEEISIIIQNNTLFRELTEVLAVLRPVAVALDKLQGEKATIADAVESWLSLQQELGDYASNAAFLKNFKRAMEPASIAAYMFHPKHRGKNLSPALIESGHDWLIKKNPYFVIAAENLKLEDSNFYPKSLLHPFICEKMSPALWWSSVSDSVRLPVGLKELCQTLMRLPASTAGIERNFSTMSNIITKLRNRLGIEKASKLCYIHQYLRGLDKTDVYFEDSDLD